MFYHLQGTLFAQEVDTSALAPIVTDSSTMVSADTSSPDSTFSTGAITVVVNEMGDVISIVTGDVTTGNDLTGEIFTGEILTGEILTGEISTGNILTGGILTGEILTGEIEIGSGVEDRGTSTGNIILLEFVPLAVIYPEKIIKLNASGYVVVDSLESVVTTGGEIGATYCSRITYENIADMLKAGIWTRRETNDYIQQGDADRIIDQGIADNTLIEVSSGDLQKIFTGDVFASGSSIYDVYVTFLANGTKVYHRITVLYGDDGIRYVLDPLRGAKTLAPQRLSEYLAYYYDETDAHRYVGRGYSPMIIGSGIIIHDQLLTYLSGETISPEIFSGNIFVELTGESDTSGNVVADLTGTVEQTIVTNDTGSAETPTSIETVPATGNAEQIPPAPISPAVLDGSQGGTNEVAVETGNIVDTGVVVDSGIVEDTGIQMLDIFETGYFDHAFQIGEINEQVTTLQMVLTSLGYFSGTENGTFDATTMEALYQYQFDKNIIASSDAIGLRGYMGPSTRRALNIDLQNYKNQLTTNSGTKTVADDVLMTGNVAVETGTLDLGINESLNITGYNRGLIFDPSLNPDLFSGLLADTGLQSYFSGYQYVTGDLIDLVFDTGTQENIMDYLLTRGFTTGSLTLLPMSYAGLVGDSVIDMSLFSGKLLVPIILQSTNEMSGQMAEVELPEGTLLKTVEGDAFTGDLMPPVFLDTESLTIDTNENIVSAIDVGSDEGITFEDGSGNSVNAVFRVPVPGANIGDILSVNYSEDGKEWTYLDAAEVIDIDGEPYVTFTADHFTTFYMGTLTGTFTINNDDAFTTGMAVNLNMSMSGAGQMRFGNTIAERDLASWVSYATGYAWNLTGLYSGEVKRVYAQFSGNNVVRNVSDSIVYDINSGANTSGLQLHLNASTGGTRFYDIGYRNLFFTGINGAYKSTWSGEEIMVTDGINDYIEGTSGFITNYPFTISAWVKPSRVNVIQTLVMFGNSATNTTSYGIRLLATGAPSAVAQNTTATTATSTTILQANKRYHIIGVFASATSRTIYVDNTNPITNTATATFSATNQRRRIGRHPGTSTTNYYSGAIDEVHVYNRSLTTGERQAVFMVPPSFDAQTAFTGTPTLYGSLGDKMYLPTLVISGITYLTTGDGPGKWMTLPMITGLANGTYNVTLNYTNVYDKTGTINYVSGLVVALPSSTGLRVAYSTTGRTSGDVVATLTGLDPTYLIVNNLGSEFFTFTGNGSFTYQFVDKQGTTGTITASVTWIDKIMPTFSGMASGAIYSGNVTITFGDANLSGATLNGSAYVSGTTITGEGNYTFVVSDLAGNSTGAIFTIDKTQPTFAGVNSGSVYTGVLSGGLYVGNVSIIFSDANLSGATLNGNAYASGTVITGAGDYVFEVSDLAGNATGASFTIYLPTEQQINNQLINSGYAVGTTSLVALDGNYYIGTADINLASLSGQLLLPTVLQSDNLYAGNLSEVEIPEGAVLKNVGGSAFTGILNVPTFQTPSTYDAALGRTVISAIDVGSTNHIYFKDTGDNQLLITYRMPVPGRIEGDLVDVFMSEDGNSFDYHTTVPTILIGGQPYVVFVADHMSVAVTSANNGLNISADKAANSTSGSAYMAVSNIVIAEQVNSDFAANQTNTTLILTAPSNRRFKAGSGTVTYIAGRDITSASLAVTSSTIMVTFSTDANANKSDTITISGVQVQAFTGNILPSSGNIMRLSSNPGTATIAGITNDVTNFGSLSQTFGAHKYLLITLSGQTFVAGSGNSGVATNQYAYTGFVIPRITATDQFYNIVTSYAGNKTLSYTGPGGTPSYTTGVTFATGQSTTILNTTLTEAKTGVTLTVSDGPITGPASSAFDVIDALPPSASVYYVPTSGALTTGTVTATLTGFNKTGIIVTNNGGSTSYVFTGNGSFIFNLQDGVGNTGSVTATVDWTRKSWLTYSPVTFYEDQLLNNGSITGNMIVTLGTGAFSGNVSNYVTLSNVPAGLTGVFTLSGTNKLIVTLSGNAANHSGSDSTGNLVLSFSTGAFVNMYPSDVIDATKTGLSVVFYGPNPEIGLAPLYDTMIDADTDPTGVGNCSDGKCQKMNYGATNYICASDFGSKILFKFDFSSIPAGAVITSAQLRLYRFQINGATDATGFTIKKIINNSGWIEGTRNAATALTGEPNYIQRKRQEEYRNNGSPGMVGGVDYATTNLISSVGFTGSNTGSYTQYFPFTTNGISLLQSWADGGENQGLVMGDIPVTTDHRLCVRSKEATNSAERPSLIVSYYVDLTAPSLVSTNPANNETGVAVSSNLFMYFSENMSAVSGYNVSIRKLVDASLVESINASNTGRITITTTQVKITPSNPLESATGYYVEVASGAFRDAAGNVYPGFTGSGTWKFTTINTAQLPIVTGSYVTGIYATTGIFGATIESDGGSPIIERGFCWSTVQGFNDCIDQKTSETGTSLGTGAFTLPVSGLPAGTQVYFKAIAVNAGGTAYAAETGFITRPAQPVFLSPTKIDNDSFVAHRNAMTGASSYNFYVSTDSGFASYVTGYAPLTGLVNTDIKVIGLNRTTQYYYKVSAVNSAGESLHSLVTGLTTIFYPTPIAWLKFEETFGTNAYDSAEGSYHDGVLFGDPTKNQSGVDGRAFCYDGTNDDVNIVNFNYGSRYTIGFRFKTAYTGNNMHMFSHGGDSDASSINVILDGATKTLRTYVNGNQSLFILGSGIYNDLVDNERHYYTVSVDNSGAVAGKYQVVVYVDGLYELIDSSLDSTTYLPENNLVIGRTSDGTTGFYSGCIDDFRIFEQVLATGEVGDLFNQLKPDAAGYLSITGPVSFDFGAWDASNIPQIIQTNFTGVDDYFKVIDGAGADLGYYTTLSISDFMNTDGDRLSNTNVSVKTLTGVITLAGSPNANVTSAITGSYQLLGTGALTFIRRNTGINGSTTGTYGTYLGFQVIVPPVQNYGDYTGVITFTIYDN